MVSDSDNSEIRPVWLVGASFRRTNDQTPRFLRDGMWEIGRGTGLWMNDWGSFRSSFPWPKGSARRVHYGRVAEQMRVKAKEEGPIPRRTGFLNALATAEATIIALHLAIVMVYLEALLDCREFIMDAIGASAASNARD